MAEKNIQLQLICGTSDELPYKDLKFDVVILGFCMFWVDRKYLMKTVSEADRVLKEGGYLVIVDFDTFIPYKKDNVHNPDAWTYKMQYINLFLSNPQYCLVKILYQEMIIMYNLAIIQARMGSSRLPGKVLMKLEGKPVLWHVASRVSRSSYVDDVVVATTFKREG